MKSLLIAALAAIISFFAGIYVADKYALRGVGELNRAKSMLVGATDALVRDQAARMFMARLASLEKLVAAEKSGKSITSHIGSEIVELRTSLGDIEEYKNSASTTTLGEVSKVEVEASKKRLDELAFQYGAGS